MRRHLSGSSGSPPAPERAPAGARHRWMVRLVAVALAVAGLGPASLVAGARPALANDYLYLKEKNWTRLDSVGNAYTLTARIAIETDGSGNGRFRFRLQCFRTDYVTGRRTTNSCDFHFASGNNAYWCNSQPPTKDGKPPAACVSRHLDDQSGGDVLWVGGWHTLAHQVEFVHVNDFRATFNAGAGPVGVYHWIASAGAIVNLANQQAANGYAEWDTNCNYYSPGGPGAVCAPWCAMFATWVWDIVGAPEVTSTVRTTYLARKLGWYGQQWGRWHATGPKTGDWAIWGTPTDEPASGHVDIVVKVYSDGSLDLVGGNLSNKVTLRHIVPGTTTTNGQPLSGYVTPSY